jgi:hypothetical protein
MQLAFYLQETQSKYDSFKKEPIWAQLADLHQQNNGPPFLTKESQSIASVGTSSLVATSVKKLTQKDWRHHFHVR